MEIISENPYNEAHQSLYDLCNVLDEHASRQSKLAFDSNAINKLQKMLKIIDEDNNFYDEIEFQNSKVQTELIEPQCSSKWQKKKNDLLDEAGSGDLKTMLPSNEELVKLLEKNEEINRILSAEVNQLTGELNHLKDEISSVVHENNLLHNQLRKTAFESLHTQPQPALPPNNEILNIDGISNVNYADSTQIHFNNFKLQHWQNELQKLTKMHANKAEILTSQLSQIKVENKRLLEDLDNLKTKCKSSERGGGLVSGLCIECSSRLAVVKNPHQLESVTNERNELSRNISLLQSELKKAQLREESCFIQVKNAVAMTEQAHVEMTQAYVERQQARTEYESLKARFDDHMMQYEKRLNDDSAQMAERSQARVAQLNNTNRDLVEKVATLDESVERLSRERVILQTDLEIMRAQMIAQQQEFAEAMTSSKVRVTNANNNKHFQQQEVEHLKQQLAEMKEERHVERSRWKEEIESLGRRLHEAERDLLESKRVGLNQQDLQLQLQQESQMMKSENEKMKMMTEDFIERQKESHQRESEKDAIIKKLNSNLEVTRTSLEENFRSQESLNKKLKCECKRLIHKLEQVISTYKQLKHNNVQLKVELQDERDKTANQSEASAQMQQLLMKESNLLKENALLSMQVDYLQNKLILPENQHFFNDNSPTPFPPETHILNCAQSGHPTDQPKKKKVPTATLR